MRSLELFVVDGAISFIIASRQKLEVVAESDMVDIVQMVRRSIGDFVKNRSFLASVKAVDGVAGSNIDLLV